VDNVRFIRASSTERGAEADDTPAWAELLSACGRGDEAAFAQLYDLTSARMYGIVLRVVRDSAQAAEVTQDAYLQIWRESARYDSSRGSALSWLMTIAHRRAVDRVRSAQAATDREDRYVTMQAERPYDEVSERAALSLEGQRVRKVMQELTDTQREAITLTYYGGYTHRETAEMLHVPLGTVKTRIRDGLIRLRDTLGVSDGHS
jgi:RNA polymerase sigma-70 factor (ECF subfamily)